MLSLLRILLVIATPLKVGAIHVFIDSGNEIFLDMARAGVSSQAEGGRLLESVEAGDHEIMIRTPDGATMTIKVHVEPGQTTTVPVSVLGLRGRARGDDSTLEVEVTSSSPTCTLSVGSEQVSGASEDLRMEHVRTGRQRVVVTCGQKTAAADVRIPAGKILSVRADLNTGAIDVTNERPRVTQVKVPTQEDAIMRLDLPFQWKRAIAGALVAGVRAKQISRKGTGVDATFAAPSLDILDEFLGRLQQREEVAHVRLYDWGYVREGGAEIRVFVAFNTW